MANVKLRIQINSDASNEALGQISTDNMEFANTSIQPNADGVFSAFPKLSNATSGINALTYGQELCFNDSDVLDNIDGFGAGLDDEQNPVEVVWGIVNEDKTYNVTLTFTGATGLQNVIVYGDKESKQFPTRAILDGTKEVFSDDYAWTIEFDEPSDTHTVQFTHWNRVNYNAVLTLIDIMLQNYEVDIYNGLKSVESLSQSSADTTGIFYGSIENSGSIDIMDRSGELVDLLEDGIMDNSNVPITVLVNGKEVQHHISTDSSYNRNSKTISIELGNRLSTLDLLKYKGYNYPDHPENLANLLFDVLSNLRYALFGKDKTLDETEFEQMLSARYDSSMTLYDYLYSIEVQYPVIEANKTYREVIDEFCLIAQMQMYIDDDNNVKFVTARPKYFGEDLQAIHIPKKNMFSQLDYAVILKNKYDEVEISQTNVRDNIDIETTLYTWKSEDEEYEQLTDSDSDETTTTFSGVSIYSYVRVTATYYTATVKFKKQSDNNLEKILSVLDGVDLSGNPRIKYNVNYTHKTGGVNVIQIADSSSSVQFVPEYTFTEEGSGSLANYGIISDAVGSTVSASLNDKTNLKTLKITSDDNYYYADFKILVGLTKIHGSFTQATTTISGVSETYIPNSVELSIYGNKRTISFEQVQKSTVNIETAKTKVSLNSSTLIQTDAVIDTIKNNILADYMQGVSNASVSISCNDYFDNNGKKVINWANGEIPQVNQIVYFDNDLYKDQSQRYWKIKGRNFRKTGVPMVDLELEELINKPLESFTWEQINEISQQGLASYMFNLGDTKAFTLSTGEALVAQIVGFNNEEKADGTGKAGITFVLKNPTKSTYQMYESGSYSWEKSLMRLTTLVNIYNQIGNDLQSVIKEIKRTYSDFSSQKYILDKLYLPTYDDVFNYDYKHFSNIENRKKDVKWWLGDFTGPSLGVVDINGDFTTGLRTDLFSICFAFCI